MWSQANGRLQQSRMSKIPLHQVNSRKFTIVNHRRSTLQVIRRQ